MAGTPPTNIRRGRPSDESRLGNMGCGHANMGCVAMRAPPAVAASEASNGAGAGREVEQS